MSINRNVIVPIPDEANHPKTGKRVFVTLEKIYDQEAKFNRDRRKSIGEACSETEMFPNDAYKIMYPDIYNKYAPHEQKISSPFKILGPYAAFLGIGQQCGIYDVLINSFGPQNANIIMDYSIYSILTQSNVSKDFAATMKKHVLFSEKAYSDTWISEFFKTKMTESQGIRFRDNWIRKCQETGTRSVWLCIDGSNNDCDSKQVVEAENGLDKSGNGGPIVSYMWAVSSKDGRPVTYSVYRGSRVDSKALDEMVKFLSCHKIKVKGIILDRGFWCNDDIDLLEEKEYDYVIMMKGGKGFDEMKSRYGAVLKSERVQYMVDKSGMYGITDKVKVFGNSDRELDVTLFYSNVKSVCKVNKLTDEVKKTKADIQNCIDNSKKYKIPADLKKYYTIKKYKGRKKDEIIINEDILQNEIDSKGFSALASSMSITPNEIDKIYQLRQYSEKQYSTFKTQLGYDVLRVYTTESWQSKFAVGFVAGILRNELENHCLKVNVDTNSALRELEFLIMTRMPDNNYVYVRTMSNKAKDVLNDIGIIESDMDLIVNDENNRLNGPYHHPIHKLPIREVIKRGPGRPPGSKNKSKKQQRKKVIKKPQKELIIKLNCNLKNYF